MVVPRPSRGAALISRRLLLLLAALVVVAAGLAGWLLAAHATAGKVEVSWAGPPRCSGTDVHYEHAEDPPEPDGSLVPVITARAGMSCVVTLRVANRGFANVTVDQAVLPFAGSGGQTLFEATPVGRVRPHDDRVDDIDAAYDLGVKVPRGQTRTVRVALGFRPEGCEAAGRGGAPRWPTLRMAALGRDFTRSASEELYLRNRRDHRGDCFD